MHWAAGYIGKGWQAGAAGPDAFDCRTLFLKIQRDHFGRPLSPILTDATDTRAVLAAFRALPGRAAWRPTDAPHEGDAVLMRQSHRPCHIGVWLGVDGGGILHAVRGAGVVFQGRQALGVFGLAVASYWTYVGAQKS